MYYSVVAILNGQVDGESIHATYDEAYDVAIDLAAQGYHWEIFTHEEDPA